MSPASRLRRAPHITNWAQMIFCKLGAANMLEALLKYATCEWAKSNSGPGGHGTGEEAVTAGELPAAPPPPPFSVHLRGSDLSTV